MDASRNLKRCAECDGYLLAEDEPQGLMCDCPLWETGAKVDETLDPSEVSNYYQQTPAIEEEE